jgi:hypothetical protein
MSYNGSGTFQINSTGQPVVSGTIISSATFNALTADLATGLTTAITKDGQTTTTARIPFALGINSTLVTDSSSVSTGSIITAGGVGIAKKLYVGTDANIGGTLVVTGVATFSATPIYSSLTASSAVATDASKNLVSVTNTGTGSNVLATSPTLVTPALGTPTAIVLTSGTGLPISTGVSGLGTDVATALAVNVGTAGAPVVNGGVLGTPSSGTLSGCTVDGTDAVGFRNIPINSKSAAYTTVLADSGKVIFHPSTDANARTFTIDSNANVAYPLGTAITFINMTSQVVTIAITSDTMYLSNTGTTGSRSLGQYGSATAIKMTSTTWLISGSGLT